MNNLWDKKKILKREEKKHFFAKQIGQYYTEDGKTLDPISF